LTLGIIIASSALNSITSAIVAILAYRARRETSELRREVDDRLSALERPIVS